MKERKKIRVTQKIETKMKMEKKMNLLTRLFIKWTKLKVEGEKYEVNSMNKMKIILLIKTLQKDDGNIDGGV